MTKFFHKMQVQVSQDFRVTQCDDSCFRCFLLSIYACRTPGSLIMQMTFSAGIAAALAKICSSAFLPERSTSDETRRNLLGIFAKLIGTESLPCPWGTVATEMGHVWPPLIRQCGFAMWVNVCTKNTMLFAVNFRRFSPGIGMKENGERKIFRIWPSIFCPDQKRSVPIIQWKLCKLFWVIWIFRHSGWICGKDGPTEFNWTADEFRNSKELRIPEDSWSGKIPKMLRFLKWENSCNGKIPEMDVNPMLDQTAIRKHYLHISSPIRLDIDMRGVVFFWWKI